MAQINIEAWDKSTDSQYTWAQDTSKINILPSTKNLDWNKVLGPNGYVEIISNKPRQ